LWCRPSPRAAEVFAAEVAAKLEAAEKKNKAGLYKLKNPVDPQLETAWLPRLSLPLEPA
jgi:hypothetical protein